VLCRVDIFLENGLDLIDMMMTGDWKTVKNEVSVGE